MPNLPPLSGRRILVVQNRPQEALKLGSTLVRAGADVTVCRTLGEAEAHLERDRRFFDAAAIDGEFAGDKLDGFIGRLRRGARPCLTVGLGRRTSPGHARALVAAGVIELIVPPFDEPSVVEAAARCVRATSHLRLRLVASRSPELEPPAPPNFSVRGRGQDRGAETHSPHDVDVRVAAFGIEHGLSPRERTVLHYIALGYRYVDIGGEISISPRTVKMHAANLRRKASVSNRHELLRKLFAD